MIVKLNELENLIEAVLMKAGLKPENIEIMKEIYLSTTMRQVGHHDIYNLPSRLKYLKEGLVNPNPEIKLLSKYGATEQYEGDNGLGEILNHFLMERAVTLAKEYGIGFATVRNSNHYLCSAPYVWQAAKEGCVGMVIAKGLPTMGLPGLNGKIIGQSPIGFAYPTGSENPVMMDICLSYVSGEKLQHMAKDQVPVPMHWGVDSDGNPTTDAEALLHGTKYPIGEHKGFGLALLCELLTGVFSGGLILDEKEEEGIGFKSTSHTAIAIKADALMPMDEYEKRTDELTRRLKARDENVHIPGDVSFEKMKEVRENGEIELDDSLISTLKSFLDM